MFFWLVSFICMGISSSLTIAERNMCEMNGGQILLQQPSTNSAPHRNQCKCPNDKFGRFCQYNCQSKDVLKCANALEHTTTCKTLLLRQPTKNYIKFSDKTYYDFEKGFSNPYTNCSKINSSHQPGECWLGFEELNEFAPISSTKFSTMWLTAFYTKGGRGFVTKCLDFGHKRYPETKPSLIPLAPMIDELHFGECYSESFNSETDVEFSDELWSINRIPFSTPMVDRSAFNQRCANGYQGSWFFEGCAKIYAMGDSEVSVETPDNDKIKKIHVDISGTSHRVHFDYFQLDICTHGCPNNFFGERCNLKCPDECERNGGTCSFVYDLDTNMPKDDAQSVSRIDCTCPEGKYGRVCQYQNCQEKNAQECFESLKVEEECLGVLKNTKGSGTFWNVKWDEYVNGFGDLKNGNNGWIGLEKLYEFSPFESEKPSSLKFTVEDESGTIYSKTCIDPGFKNRFNDYAIYLASPDQCFGDSEIPSEDILYHTQVGFTTVDHDVDLNEEKNNAYEEIGGWWYRHGYKILPTGVTEAANPLKGIKFPSIDPTSSMNSVSMEICRYKCAPGSVGEFCNIKCPANMCQNGGVCVIVGSETTGIPGVQCKCLKNYYGRKCQFFCDRNDLGDCLKYDVDANVECKSLVLRQKYIPETAENTRVSFSNKVLSDYIAGFGDEHEYWTGLDPLVSFLNKKQSDDDFSTIIFNVGVRGHQYKKTCLDFDVTDKTDGYTVDLSHCFGDRILATEDIHFMKKSKFSTIDADSSRGCAGKYGGGWWHFSDECHRIYPTGNITALFNETKKGVIFHSLTGDAVGVSYFRVDVCNNYVKSTEENLVVHKTDSLSFEKSYRDFSEGFGDCANGNDCFNGLDYMSTISNKFVEMDMVFDINYHGDSYSATCKARIGDKQSGYELRIREDTCSTSNNDLSLTNILYHNRMKFSASDSDNDTSIMSSEESQCAIDNACGWWYNNNEGDDCYEILPTGKFGEKMKYESLNVANDDTVSSFNIKMVGSVKDKSGEVYAEELRSKTCKKILVRKDGSLSFEKTYKDYVKGFGNCYNNNQECWVGLSKLEKMTSSQSASPKKLLIDISHYHGGKYTLGCLDFSVYQDEDFEYKFDLGACYGSSALSREMLRNQVGKPFSTIDHEVAGHSFCASTFKSGWFYDDSCGGFIPSGEYGKNIKYDSVTQITESIDSLEISICGTFEEEIDDAGCIPFFSRQKSSSKRQILFDRSYSEYVLGFGNPSESTEGWLGLETLHRMTEIPQLLDIQYTPSGETTARRFRCGIFHVESSELEYEVHFDLCELNDLDDESTILSDLLYHNGAKFSTYDHPTEMSGTNCAIASGGGGWWYHSNDDECYKFNPSGQFYRSDDRGVHFGQMQDLDAIQMSICRTRFLTEDPQSFSEEKTMTRSCSNNCHEYHGKFFELKAGEQIFMFNEEYYSNTNNDMIYLNVLTGPKKELMLEPTTMSFYTQKITYPVIFASEDFDYFSPVTRQPAMMYIRSTCNAVDECGWRPLDDLDDNTVIFKIRSAYVPHGWKITFFEPLFKDVDQDSVMYEMGGGGLDLDINMEIKSWLLEQEVFTENHRYPVLYKDTMFATEPRELRYSCARYCEVYGYRSLFVPSTYIVELFSEADYGGISRKFVGPTTLEFLDGYFGSHNILSYKAELTRITKIDVNIVKFHFDQVQEDESAENNVNELVVMNPSNVVREVLFTDTYITSERREWTTDQFLVSGSTNDTEVHVQSDHSIGYSLNTGIKTDIEIKAGVAIGAGFAFTSIVENVFKFEAGIQYVRDGRANTATASDSTDQVTFAATEGSETGGITENIVEKTFNYQCIGLPFTKTVCQAKQVTGVYSIPYDYDKVIYYSNGTTYTVHFYDGIIQNAVATDVYFTVKEYPLEGFCKNGFKEFNGDCYIGAKIASEDNIKALSEGLIPQNKIKDILLPMDMYEGDNICYQNEGAEISSVHSSLENFQVMTICNHIGPTLIGVKYFVSTNTHLNIDGSPFDYSRFRRGTSLPSKDSYVVIDEEGYWKYIPNDEPPEALCAICKKDLNMQLMV